MENTQQTNNQQTPMDGPSEAELTDAQIADLYTNGLISRAEADIFDIIANFDEGGMGGTPCHA